MSTDFADVVKGGEAAFPEEEFAERVERARAVLESRGIDVLLVTGPENIFYLTGQQTPGYYTYQALLLPVDGEPVFILRQLEVLNLVANSFLDRIEPYPDNADPVDVTVDALRRAGCVGKRIAVDERAWFMPIAIYKALLAELGDLADGSGAIEQLRAVKSPSEIAKLEESAVYVAAGMRAGLAAVRAGAIENDLVAAMMGAAIAAGSEYVGMEPLVSGGPRSGVPHGTWRRRRLRPGEPAFLELAASHDRYHAALMRSAWLGPPPDAARRMMDCCLEGLDAALGALRPGATCEDVHLACQRVVDRDGFTDAYRKRTGYSVGISFAPDWGEGNVLSLFNGVTTEIVPGMCFHLPPALRRYGEFTVGVSEVAIVTETGNRTLSTIQRDLTIV